MKFYEELWQQLPVPGFVIDRSDDIIELNIAAEQFVGAVSYTHLTLPTILLV